MREYNKLCYCKSYLKNISEKEISRLYRSNEWKCIQHRIFQLRVAINY